MPSLPIAWEAFLIRLLERLLELIAIERHPGDFRAQFDFRHNAPVFHLRFEEPRRFPHQIVDVRHLELGPAGPDRPEKLRHDKIETLDLALEIASSSSIGSRTSGGAFSSFRCTSCK